MSYRIGITLLTSLISSFLDKPEVFLSNFFFSHIRESLASELLPFFLILVPRHPYSTFFRDRAGICRAHQISPFLFFFPRVKKIKIRL